MTPADPAPGAESQTVLAVVCHGAPGVFFFGPTDGLAADVPIQLMHKDLRAGGRAEGEEVCRVTLAPCTSDREGGKNGSRRISKYPF